ncbi:hypothetical protein Hypma_009984 [Hypsizygus marmoreus]|uniref:REJ domain-containing protein n=1 Tax=Hypsizygus marmoreus TaxID=39966 RepID=A0A369JMK0_HYPMA|nr:hypothetical protein Hypma_009984 [Hypsizygus marmoreus]
MHGQSYPGPQRRHIDLVPRQAATTSGSETVLQNSTSITSDTQAAPGAPTPAPSSSNGSSSTSTSPSSSTSSGSESSRSTSISTSTFTSQQSSTTRSESSTTSDSTSSTSQRSSSSSTSSSSKTTVINFATVTVVNTLSPEVTLIPLTGTNLIVTVETSPTTSWQTFTITPSASNTPKSAASMNFFDNKGAVAGTFAVVSFVGLGLIVGIFFVMKKRAERRRLIADEHFEDFTSAGPEMAQSATGHNRSVSAVRSASPGASITDLSSHTPMDPFSGNQTYLSPNYGTGYTSQGLSSVQERDSDFSHSSNNSASSHHSPPSYYAPPPTDAAAPPVVNRKFVARDSYQPSIDSFYGGA